ncbi:DUF3015 family protein [Zoogloea sp.]|jgi:hypothetical protein|uniref:DUF3015 family protein n=1 Tax=Zoogloea sp. TaxID=49181 RepID=UPI0035AEC249
MKIKKTAIAFALLALQAVAANAQMNNSGPVGSGPNPYSECGIGAALFKDVHWAAITSNVIWDLGTTALTSATASPQTCNARQVKAALFIRDTYEQLAEETARGQGEHLATALNLFECDAAAHAAVIGDTRKSMGEAVAASGYATQPRLDKAAGLYRAIASSAAQRCTI